MSSALMFLLAFSSGFTSEAWLMMVELSVLCCSSGFYSSMSFCSYFWAQLCLAWDLGSSDWVDWLGKISFFNFFNRDSFPPILTPCW